MLSRWRNEGRQHSVLSSPELRRRLPHCPQRFSSDCPFTSVFPNMALRGQKVHIDSFEHIPTGVRIPWTHIPLHPTPRTLIRTCTRRGRSLLGFTPVTFLAPMSHSRPCQRARHRGTKQYAAIPDRRTVWWSSEDTKVEVAEMWERT